jgi:hypothetical protein
MLAKSNVIKCEYIFLFKLFFITFAEFLEHKISKL